MTHAIRFLFLAAALISGGLLATPGQAADSSSMSVTVIIPPFMAARQALEEGAVGLWTIDRPTGGLLLATRDGDADRDAELIVYRSERNMLEPVFADPAAAAAMGVTLKGANWAPLNGLQRAAYSVSREAVSPNVDVRQPVVIVLRSL